jgi:hypothetical protein
LIIYLQHHKANTKCWPLRFPIIRYSQLPQLLNLFSLRISPPPQSKTIYS